MFILSYLFPSIILHSFWPIKVPHAGLFLLKCMYCTCSQLQFLSLTCAGMTSKCISWHSSWRAVSSFCCSTLLNSTAGNTSRTRASNFRLSANVNLESVLSRVARTTRSISLAWVTGEPRVPLSCTAHVHVHVHACRNVLKFTFGLENSRAINFKWSPFQTTCTNVALQGIKKAM